MLKPTGYAKEHEPCIIFMDEIDAIGGRRFSEGTSADREIQRTLMEVIWEEKQCRLITESHIFLTTQKK